MKNKFLLILSILVIFIGGYLMYSALDKPPYKLIAESKFIPPKNFKVIGGSYSIDRFDNNESIKKYKFLVLNKETETISKSYYIDELTSCVYELIDEIDSNGNFTNYHLIEKDMCK